jgi:hypothetical protein
MSVQGSTVRPLAGLNTVYKAAVPTLKSGCGRRGEPLRIGLEYPVGVSRGRRQARRG